MNSPVTLFRLWFANRIWHWRLRQTRRLFTGPRCWEALDRLGVPGFGTDLVRIDFPPDTAPSFTATRATTRPPELNRLFAAIQPASHALLATVLRHSPCQADWPEHPDPKRPDLPVWNNEFLTPIDMVVLYGIVTELRPARYVEIGSGVSTQVVHNAKKNGGLPTEIISIDPTPRLEIESLCDQTVRARLEDNIETVLSLVRPGDVLFFDGSHRSFPGSDVTRFFLDLLPRLPSGVIIHIHDIYLPNDYPPAAWNRLWSEQYMLAAWLLGGAQGMEIMLPCAELWRDISSRRILSAVPPAKGRSDDLAASSFWLRRTTDPLRA